MKKHVVFAAAMAVLAGHAVAQEPLITHERFVGTKQGIEKLSPDQKAKFDAEKARLLAEINRGPDGALLSPIKPEPAPSAPAKKARKAKSSRKARKAKAKADAQRASIDPVEKVAEAPARTIRESSILGAPVQNAKQSPVQY